MAEEVIEIPNFIECRTEDEANQVDLSKYTLVTLEKGVYYFKIRQKKT